jgi:hypothetical protein
MVFLHEDNDVFDLLEVSFSTGLLRSAEGSQSKSQQRNAQLSLHGYISFLTHRDQQTTQ